MIVISLLHHKTSFFLQFHTPTSLLNFVQLSILLKCLLIVNPTLVQLLYKSLQIILQLYLPTGHIGYIEVPITNEKPKYYQVNDMNTQTHNVTHTYTLKLQN